MKWSIAVLITAAALASLSVRAEDSVAPASQDPANVQKFGQSIKSTQADADSDKSANTAKPTDNFGAKVSAEAKKLRTEDPAQRRQFGKWVSSQRRKNNDHRPDDAQEHETEGSAHSALRNGPNGHGSGGGAGSEGASGTHSGR